MGRLKQTPGGTRPGGSARKGPSKGVKKVQEVKVPSKLMSTKKAGATMSKTAATAKYRDEIIQELKASMTSDCHYCRHVVQMDMMHGHLLYKCKDIQLPRRLQETLTKIRVEKSTRVLPGEYKWEACLAGGMCDLSMAEFPRGKTCAPFNYLYLAMDRTAQKAVSAIRGTKKAFLYEHKETGVERKRFFTDKQVHLEWEAIVRAKISAGEITEVLIPVTFLYWLANDLRGLRDRNHCALIVVKITDGKWKCSIYDSEADNRYYAKASSQIVRKFLVSRLLGNMEQAPKENANDSWLRKEPIYCSSNGKGGQAIVLFWVHLRFMGKEITHPNNTATVNFFKTLMLHVADKQNPHPLTRGDEFDLEWKVKSTQPYGLAGPDPEIQGHVEEFTAALRKLHMRENEV